MTSFGNPCFICRQAMNWNNTCFSQSVYIRVKGYEGKPLCNICVEKVTKESSQKADPKQEAKKENDSQERKYCAGRTMYKCQTCSGRCKLYLHYGMPMQRMITCQDCNGVGWKYINCPHNCMAPHYY